MVSSLFFYILVLLFLPMFFSFCFFLCFSYKTGYFIYVLLYTNVRICEWHWAIIILLLLWITPSSNVGIKTSKEKKNHNAFSVKAVKSVCVWIRVWIAMRGSQRDLAKCYNIRYRPRKYTHKRTRGLRGVVGL